MWRRIITIRTAIYIDGFNFYYGCFKNNRVVVPHRYKWCDLKKLFKAILEPHNEIQDIHYFTAKLSPTNHDPDIHIRQQAYFRALTHTIPSLTIHYGQFRKDIKKMKLAHQPGFADVIKTEEKGSDVNMAVHLLNDAWRDKYDCAVAVTNDSDLAESLKLAKQQSKVIGLITAHNVNPHRKLKEHADFHRRIKKHHLKNSMMPTNIPSTNIRMPDKWN